ncbi:MAG TPA: hypothetical protein VLA33_08725 [Gemmatimonadota bacterium]|nr:hypothetical protein [Gemmatimonadota bacterium]
MKTSTLMLRMALFVVLGAPLVWVVWEAVNVLLTGHPGEVRLLPTLAALVLLIGLLLLVGRSASRVGGPTAD